MLVIYMDITVGVGPWRVIYGCQSITIGESISFGLWSISFFAIISVEPEMPRFLDKDEKMIPYLDISIDLLPSIEHISDIKKWDLGSNESPLRNS